MSPTMLLAACLSLCSGPARAEAPRAVVTLPDSQVQVFVDAPAEAVEDALADLAAGRWTEAATQLDALVAAGGGADLSRFAVAAWFEAGRLDRAAARVTEARRRHPDDLDLSVLAGLILAEQGQGDEALGVLRTVSDLGDRPGLLARAELVRGSVYADRGDPEPARTAWTAARDRARAAGLSGLVARAEAQLATLTLAPTPDLVGRVSDALRRGDGAAAQELVDGASPRGTRETLHRAVAAAMVARSRGELGPAAASLIEALDRAEQVGLVREALAIRLELARVYRLAGEAESAAAQLRAGRQAAGRTHFGLRAFDLEAATVRLALYTDDLDEAEAALRRTMQRAEAITHPLVALQADELRGVVASRRGDATAAATALAQAARGWAEVGFVADAARVGAAWTQATAASGQDPTAAREATLRWFSAAGDPLGPAHTAIAEGLGHVCAEDVEAALADFAAAARSARSVGGDEATRVATVAEADAAEALEVLGHRPEAVAAAREHGLEDAVARHRRFTEARSRYEEGRAHFDGRRFPQAQVSFEAAARTFASLGETAHARSARSAWGWSAWNAAVGQRSEASLGVLERVADAAEDLGESELRIRARVAHAVMTAALERPGAAAILARAHQEATSEGFPRLAATCRAEQAVLPGPVAARARWAREALAVLDDEAGAYAAYAVAVDALNDGDADLARSLAQEALPRAGRYEASVREVLDAASGP